MKKQNAQNAQNATALSYQAGIEYAQFLATDGPVGIVDIGKQLTSSSAMPDGDYTHLKSLGIEPDERAYWEGFNAECQSAHKPMPRND